MVLLPIKEALPALREALRERRHALLTAPPGAGKSTAVPLALLDEPWMIGKKLLMLEPRRLAAQAVAHRMASMLGEPVGTTVGYRMRLDTKVGPTTRIEVVTEGILPRLLQSQLDLRDYAAVIFDEFHERSLEADAGLALSLEVRRLFRPDLRLLVMSATLDCGPVAALLGDAPAIRLEGTQYPVDTQYLDEPASGPLDAVVAKIVRRSLAVDHGSILIFLPGMGEIRSVERKLRDANLGPDVLVAPLHGELPQAAQEAAIRPAPPGKRKIVLATSIAETSLTIEGVRIVIDAGWLRLPRYDPRSGLTKLATIPVTRDSADQRRGRAGRMEPGVCYRLWTEKEQQQLAPCRPPEILEADLTPLVLDLAHWGITDPFELTWLTPPPAGAVAQARAFLKRIGALNAAGAITDHGRRMADLPLHPRLSHMVLKSIPLHHASLACDLAAMLGERDLIRGPSGGVQTDLRLRLDALYGELHSIDGASVDQTLRRRVQRAAGILRRRLGQPSGRSGDLGATGLLLALAYPDRIAQRQPGSEGRYLLANGRGAIFSHPDPLASEPYLVIADLDAGSQWARIDLAAPIDKADIDSIYAGEIIETETVEWDTHSRSVTATRKRKLGALVLAEQALSTPDPSLAVAALLEGVRHAGLTVLAWTPELHQWRARVQFLKRITNEGSGWPDLSDEALLRTLDLWLGPYVRGVMALNQLQRLDLAQPLRALLTREQQQELDRLAPTHVTVPSGSRIRIDYENSDLPILSVRIQELFGCRETPRIAGGKVPLILHLLSPANRPVQITQDLAAFWSGSYREVRKALRGRYPKHHWPEDPLAAPPAAQPQRRAR